MRKNVVSLLLVLAILFLLLPIPSAHADDFDLDSLRERYAILVDANDPTTALYGIEKNADELEKLLQEGDYENYTIKVHALKSSARLIGAEELSETARKLEAYGNFINSGSH